ncbi:cellulose synthase [Deltaproteobacteria bacterium]|nr:cellulose synthase [Deltaproteobacteria bacterium]
MMPTPPIASPPPFLGALGGALRDRLAVVSQLKPLLLRGLIVLNLALLVSYLVWRGAFTLSAAAWPLSLALLGAELYSFVDTSLFCLGVWRIREREKPPPPADVSVDVFITCYNEPVELVRATARAARAMRRPHLTFILDDGQNPQMEAIAAEEGVGYLRRDPSWQGKNRHAKAGNLINALHRTQGEFILVLDADHRPRPELLERTLGYFDDPLVAFVQTPQWFSNIPPGDPFGVDAPLFYGPIMQGKDGWNAAFFCGSNAVLRRDALMRAGLADYARETEARVRSALRGSEASLRAAASALDPDAAAAWAALRAVGQGARTAEDRLGAGAPLQEVTWAFQRQLRADSEAIVARDLGEIDAALGATPGVPHGTRVNPAAVGILAGKEHSPLAAIPEVRRLIADTDLDRADEAEPVLPVATISVTEDMATAMRLHALGYRSVYHHEVLAVGLAPDDLRSALQQRLRWAQGTMQVFLRENPLAVRGLTWPQRLMYFSTVWSYLSGFASVVYLLCPVLYLLFGLSPVQAYNGALLTRLVPCLVVNQLVFIVVGYGLPTWRGQQYSLALFPLWIEAVATAVRNVYFGVHLPFVVTPKTRQGGAQWSLVRPQLVMLALLALAIGKGLVQVGLGRGDTFPILINMAWATYSVVMLGVVVHAARWRPTQLEGQS